MREPRQGLRKIICKTGKTQAIIAHEIGMTPALLSMILSGKKKLPKKYREHFCKILGIGEKTLKQHEAVSKGES